MSSRARFAFAHSPLGTLLYAFVKALLVVAGLLALTGLAGCRRGAEPEKMRPPVVRVVTPVSRKVTDYSYYTGRTDAIQSVNVQPRVTGYLVSIDFVSGQEVKKAQRLFKIDPRPYQATLDAAVGQVKLSEAQFHLAVADFKRAEEVAKTPGAISKQDLDKYAASQAEAAAAVDAAKANAESARLNLEFTDINSDLDGIVSRNLLSLGDLVKQDTSLLTTVVSQDPIWVYFDVDELTMLRVQNLIREGKLKSLAANGVIPVDIGLTNEGTEFPHLGKLDFVNNQVDRSTGTIQVRGVFPNPIILKDAPRLLKPGLFVRIRLPLGEPYQALLVPQAALGTDQGKKYLLVVNDKNVAEYRPITPGPQQPDGLQVVFPIKLVRTKNGLVPKQEGASAGDLVDSLTAGEQLIVGGLQRVRAGMTVEARPLAAESLRTAAQ